MTYRGFCANGLPLTDTAGLWTRPCRAAYAPPSPVATGEGGRGGEGLHAE